MTTSRARERSEATATMLGLGPTLAPAPSEPAESAGREGTLIAERYRLVERIAVGGGSEVWEVVHVTLKTRHALKILSRTALPPDELAERLRFEAQLNAQLAGVSSGVVRVHDVGLCELGPFIVMDLVRGPSLEVVIGRGPLSPAAAADLLDQLGEIVDLFHQRGVVHRDVQPGNVLAVADVAGREKFLLTGFGVAKVVGTSLEVDHPTATVWGIVRGTPDYVSPEQIRGELVHPSFDLWALAVTIYATLTGTTPWGPQPSAVHTLQAIASGRSIPIREKVPELSSRVEQWFGRALHREVRQRFTSGRAMAEAFRECVIQSRVPETLPQLAVAVVGEPESPAPPPGITPDWRRLVRRSSALLAAVFTLGAGFLVAALMRAGEPANPRSMSELALDTHDAQAELVVSSDVRAATPEQAALPARSSEQGSLLDRPGTTAIESARERAQEAPHSKLVRRRPINK